MKDYKFKRIQIAKLISKYMYYFLTSIFTITIICGVLYFHSHYRYPLFCNTCASCRGCSPLLSLEYEQNKLLFFTTIFPWIVSLNIIAIILTIILEKLFKNSLIKRILKTTEFYKNQNIVEKINRIKYKEDIKKEQHIKARIVGLESL